MDRELEQAVKDFPEFSSFRLSMEKLGPEHASLKQSFWQTAAKFAQVSVPERTAQTAKAFHALDFEVKCVVNALEAGEALDRRARFVRAKVPFNHYRRDGALNGIKDAVCPKFDIQNDVPVWRHVTGKEGLPYVVEAKTASSRAYGQNFQDEQLTARIHRPHVNQLIKYQAAIDKGLIMGASVQIEGRLHPHFIRWMMEGSLGGGSEVPDVEVIYVLPLPSGAVARCVLKPVSEGLRFINHAIAVEDEPVVAGLHTLSGDPFVLSQWVNAPWGNDSQTRPDLEVEDAGEWRGNRKRWQEALWVRLAQMAPALTPVRHGLA